MFALYTRAMKLWGKVLLNFMVEFVKHSIAIDQLLGKFVIQNFMH